MKRLFALLLSILTAGWLSATPDINFQPGGVELGGSGTINWTFNTNLYTNSYISVSGNFFVIPFVAVGASVSTSSSADTDPTGVTRENSGWNVFGNGTYYLPVPADLLPSSYLSTQLGVGVGGGLGYMELSVNPFVRLYYFVNDVVSPWVGLGGGVYFGSTVTSSVGFWFGLSTWMPSANKALIQF